MAGVRVTQPAAGTGQGSASTTPEIDTADIDYSAGAGTDVRERQRILLAGSAVGTDIAVMNGTPTGSEYGLIVRQAAPVGSIIQSNAGTQAFVKGTTPATTDPGLVVRQAGVLEADLNVGGTPVNGSNPVPISQGPVTILGLNGTSGTSTSNRFPVDIGGATVQATFSSFVSTVNSTQTPLAANATFTGAFEDVKDYAALTGALTSDVPSATNGVVAEFALDAAGANIVAQQTTTYPGGNFGAYFAFPTEARYVRIRYTNGATAQTVFKTQVAYEFTAPTVPIQALAGQLTDANMGGVVRSILTGRLASGVMKSLVSTATGELAVNWATPLAPANAVATGTLTAAAGAAPVAQTLAPAANATAIQLTVPDGHSSWEIYLSGTFSANSQVYFEGSADGTDASWFALNGRRNADATTNEQSSLLDGAPKGGASPTGAGLSNWRGSTGGVKYLRVRCGTYTAADSINVRITTSVGVGAVFQNSNPPLPSDFLAIGTLTAVADAITVQANGAGAWSAQLTGNFTGTVFFEQTIDGTTWNKINGAVAGVGTLQTQLSGTGVANQTLAVRGGCGGLKSIRLRAGNDFVGSFTGAVRTGGGSGGVFMTAPVPIAGLSNAVITNRMTVAATGSTATRIDSPLSTRTSVEVKYIASTATNNAYVYVGLSTGTTSVNGRELSPGESWTLDITSFQGLYAVGSVANQQVQVTEIG